MLKQDVVPAVEGGAVIYLNTQPFVLFQFSVQAATAQANHNTLNSKSGYGSTVCKLQHSTVPLSGLSIYCLPETTFSVSVRQQFLCCSHKRLCGRT